MDDGGGKKSRRKYCYFREDVSVADGAHREEDEVERVEVLDLPGLVLGVLVLEPVVGLIEVEGLEDPDAGNDVRHE